VENRIKVLRLKSRPTAWSATVSGPKRFYPDYRYYPVKFCRTPALVRKGRRKGKRTFIQRIPQSGYGSGLTLILRNLTII
jgi:hypothetical protein